MSVSIVFARAVAGEVERRGLASGPLFAAAGIDVARLGDARDNLAPDECERLIDAAVALTTDEAIGLSVGAHSPQHQLHIFGHLLLAQRTIRDACAMAQRFSTLVASGPTWKLVEHGEHATWGLVSRLPAQRLRRVLMDYAVTLTARLGRGFLQVGDRLLAVQLQHEAPSYVDRYRDYFPCPVHFSQELNGLVFTRAALDRPQVHADETAAALLCESAELLLRERNESALVSSKVRAVLRYHADLKDFRLGTVARACKLGARELRGRLRDEGTTFGALVDEARCRVACEALQRSDVSLKETAEALGFSEPSAFFRAFKRWTGQTPSAFRRAARPS